MSEGDLITVQAPFADHIREKLTLDICTRLFRSDYQVNFLSTALGMVKEGLGITMTLGYAKTWVDEQGLVMIPIHEPQIGYEFLLYKHRQRSQRPAMKSFENFLVKAAKDWLLHI
ncbi:LysR substrate-binding domain-containing protein [Moraxella catarrhalis]|uniref:LysR substrate-binding domain-containing protein n=1 Tax=Moraxella catarrhalis TaxID=480 RepID=UPI0002F21556|nr:LysR substrate-binding domain-containing protein [Moraxella catarrhalis]